MFGIWFRDIELTTLTLIVSFVILLPVQLLLCFKVRSFAIRLFPVVILSVSMAVFIVRCYFTSGWGRAVYALFAIFAGFMIFMCGIGWGIWVIVNDLKKKHSKES